MLYKDVLAPQGYSLNVKDQSNMEILLREHLPFPCVLFLTICVSVFLAVLYHTAVSHHLQDKFKVFGLYFDILLAARHYSLCLPLASSHSQGFPQQE